MHVESLVEDVRQCVRVIIYATVTLRNVVALVHQKISFV